ncbi:MAG: hypothetical protein PUC45_02830, partial [Oscillospiraceae bacterium]|nr:hypothetical protein [Oscillospiraceae bacterium]
YTPFPAEQRYYNNFHLACQALFSKLFDTGDPVVISSNFLKLPHLSGFVNYFFRFPRFFFRFHPRRALPP